MNVAKLIAANFAKYGKDVGVKACTLAKSTPGTRTPGALSAGTNPTVTTYTATGLIVSLTKLRMTGTLIAGVDTAILLFGASISGGAVPGPGDRITIGGATYTIVGDAGGNKAVAADGIAATYICQCKG